MFAGFALYVGNTVFREGVNSLACAQRSCDLFSEDFDPSKISDSLLYRVFSTLNLTKLMFLCTNQPTN